LFRPSLGLVLLSVSLGCMAACGSDGGASDETNSVAGKTGSGGSGGSAAAGQVGGGTSSAGTASGGVGSGGSAAVVGAGATRAACSAPSGYRNLFTEILGKTQSDVDSKLEKVVQQMFHGTGDQPIYYELGSDQAYIVDVNNDDVRSEGMSYGMTIAVMMDMKTEFDKLWRFATARMRQQNGLFAWQVTTSGSVISNGAAPDGEEYFAMALMLASRRWGDSTGTNYGSEAKAVMKAMATQDEFNSNPVIVQFGPWNEFSDPSYVLPLFYSEWACFDSANAELWQDATTYGRTFFQKTTDPNTGLAPYQANWDGSPRAGNGDFNADSWRVPMDIMMDFNLNHADDWQVEWAERMAAFWVKEGLDSYGGGYTLSGTKTSDGNGHGAGLTGVNAMLAFALPPADGEPFLQRAWDVAIPTGKYRYYDGCLYMLSMLHMSGKFNLFY
jgi:endo-1,4-beta-D-glucanase Y